jgi:hypothetical protein
MWRVAHTTRFSLCGDFTREAREQADFFLCRDGRIRPSRRAKRGVRRLTPPQNTMDSQMIGRTLSGPSDPPAVILSKAVLQSQPRISV